MATAAMSPDFFHPLMLRAGDEAQFEAVRRVLRNAEFTEKGICERLQIKTIAGFKSIRQQRQIAVDRDEPLDVLIRLFLDGEFVPQARLGELLGTEALPAFEQLGLTASRDAQCFATVSIYPLGGLIFCSDRATNPDGSPYLLPPDAVYPAAVENTRHFLDILPATPCEALLDIGTGTGVAALLTAPRAGHVWGTDIASRSVAFAEFNRRLNHIANATIAEGNLFEPVCNLTFDRIVAHPPYVPVANPTYVFRDGGEDGEQITRGIIERLPQYLRPGGRFFAVTLGADLEGEPFERRIRHWLGEHAPAFDMILVVHSLRSPEEFALHAWGTGTATLAELRFWRDSFARRKVEHLCYGSLLIRRVDGPREGFTARVLKGAPYGAAEMEWLLAWETECRTPGFANRLLESPVAMAPDCELVVTNRMVEGELRPQQFSLVTARPFSTECRCQQWIAELAASSSGTLTGLEHYRRNLSRGSVPEGTSPEEFASLLAYLVGAGILETPGHPLPARAR